jgi:hypothetical protein
MLKQYPIKSRRENFGQQWVSKLNSTLSAADLWGLKDHTIKNILVPAKFIVLKCSLIV